MDIGRQLPLPGPGHYEPLSDSSAHHWSIVATLIQSAKVNGIDPRVWLADVLPRIADQPASRLADLLPRN
jgi:transposase